MTRETFIRQKIYEGEITEAIRLLKEWLIAEPENDEIYYLLGNAYRKEENFRDALNHYLKAIELNPDSPAREAHDMLMKIMEFYNKDMFNH